MSLIFRILSVLLLGVSTQVNAEPLFDFSASTPEGSWAVRETIVTNHKGKQTATLTRQKYLGSEQRQGKTYYWLETEIDNYKIKKNKRKRDGEHMILKVLVSEDVMNSDPANVVNNLQGFGKEIIMQTGDNPPMKMVEGGLLAGTLMKSMGMEVNYKFTPEGKETIDTVAGDFKARRVTGVGSAHTKILFKKFDMQSQSVMWFSDRVPFGIVKSENTDTVNGKESHSQTQLLEYASSGAVTAITGEAQQMPF